MVRASPTFQNNMIQDRYNFNLTISKHAEMQAYTRVCERQFADANDCLNEIYSEMDWLISNPTFMRYLDNHRFSKAYTKRIIVKDYIHNKIIIFAIKKIVELSVITFAYLDNYGADGYLLCQDGYNNSKTCWCYPDKFVFQDKEGYNKVWNWL